MVEKTKREGWLCYGMTEDPEALAKIARQAAEKYVVDVDQIMLVSSPCGLYLEAQIKGITLVVVRGRFAGNSLKARATASADE